MKTPKKMRLLNATALSLFFENLGILQSSGIPLQDCLKLMSQDTRHSAQKVLIEQLEHSLSQTFTLHEALHQVGCFPSYAVSLIKAAERSGNLEEACASLASFYEQEARNRAQVKSAILNPAILIGIMAVVIIFLVTAILPVFSDLYAQMGVDIRHSTAAGIALLVGQISMWLLVVLFTVVLVCYLLSLTRRGRYFFHHLLENSFITRAYYSVLSLSRFTSTFAMLIKSGEDLSIALSLATEVSQNQTLQLHLTECLDKMNNGEPLGDALAESQAFPPLHAGLLRAGDRAGSLPKVLTRLSTIYSEQAGQKLDAFLSVIEPLLIGFLSLLIGIILVCIMLPLLGLMSTIG